MAGNVWEWCNDFHSYTDYSSSPYNNPTGPTSVADGVLRGGCWVDHAHACRAASRSDDLSPGSLYYCVGFRCASGTP
jgi:formylglycine-generating enzyme required for sulfatase activity